MSSEKRLSLLLLLDFLRFLWISFDFCHLNTKQWYPVHPQGPCKIERFVIGTEGGDTSQIHHQTDNNRRIFYLLFAGSPSSGADLMANVFYTSQRISKWVKYGQENHNSFPRTYRKNNIIEKKKLGGKTLWVKNWTKNNGIHLI